MFQNPLLPDIVIREHERVADEHVHKAAQRAAARTRSQRERGKVTPPSRHSGWRRLLPAVVSRRFWRRDTPLTVVPTGVPEQGRTIEPCTCEASQAA